MQKQSYKKLVGDTTQIFEISNKGFVLKIETVKLIEYKNVYVSKNVFIKPKYLQRIIKNTNEAIREYKIEDDSLKIIIVSSKDGFNSYGQYDAINNIVYYNDVICNKEILLKENIELRHIERHEMWHYKQASLFRNKYGNIGLNNYSNYIKYINLKSKKLINKLGYNEEEISKFSVYAKTMFTVGRFDEVEAEIMAKKGAKNV